MKTYVLRQPVKAIQYSHQQNESEVMDLLRASGRTGASMNNARGYLHVYNNGPELRVRSDDWVVALGDDVAVLSHARFTDMFQPD